MKQILKILKQCKAILQNDHFVFTSGLHSDTYINKDALYPHINLVSKVGKMMAEKHLNENIEVVVGPALGGIILSQWTAYYLEKLSKKKVLSVYTEKNENFDQIFRRGYDVLVKDKNVMIVEDITTTGGSVQKVIKSVRKAGGIITAVEVMVSRDPDNVNSSTIGFPFSALDSIRVKQYQESQCPLCKKGIPINISIGHGNKFLAKKIV